jgi:hypothetical protein
VASFDMDQARIDELVDVVGQQRLANAEQREKLALADLIFAPDEDIEDLHPDWRSQCRRDSGDLVGVEMWIQPSRRGAAGRSRWPSRDGHGFVHINVL